MSKNLLDEINAYMARENIGPHRFGILAANNGRLVERLRAGRRIWPDTEKRVWDFLREKSAPLQERAA